jgi:hypothetical protein
MSTGTHRGGAVSGGVADRVVSGLIGAVGVYVIVESTGFDLHTVAGPWLVPMIVGILLAVLGVWGVLRPEHGGNTWMRLRAVPLAIAAAVLCAYVLMMPILGFLITTIAMSLALGVSGPTQRRMQILVCVAGTIAAVGLYLLFVDVFNVPLPDPVWTY